MRYDPHPSVAMIRKWIDTLKEKSGRDLNEWVALVKKKAPKDRKARIDWLKREHGLGTYSAMPIVDFAEGSQQITGDEDDYLRDAAAWVDAMFSGPKSALRPLADRLMELARSVGHDIRISPATTIIPIYRKHVIAQIKPSTNKRIDFGLALGKLPAKGRLIDTGGFAKKDRITHRIEITSPGDIDDFVEKWLRRAYDADA